MKPGLKVCGDNATHRRKNLATDLITSGQRRGEVRPGPVDRQAVPLMLVFQGLTALALTGGFRSEQLDEGIDETIAFLLRGYAP